MTSHLHSPHTPDVRRAYTEPVTAFPGSALQNSTVYEAELKALNEALANSEGAGARKFYVLLKQQPKVCNDKRARAGEMQAVSVSVHAQCAQPTTHRPASPQRGSHVRCVMKLTAAARGCSTCASVGAVARRRRWGRVEGRHAQISRVFGPPLHPCIGFFSRTTAPLSR
jgi:hypothetical protein